MRNTITLNGIESSEIPGLLIQTLPPISKPLMRTEIEEIDGRDGDIITPLGFSAYDKEITIGLYGEFDTDEVIQYFTSQGTVIFSNEPEKYYNYQIIQQIDFERLLRYRTATVTFHVQPFKYSTEEKAKNISTATSGEATSLILANTTAATIANIGVEGNCEQDGTPAPANEVEVQSVTGNNTVYITGKNMAYITNTFPVTNDNLTLTQNNDGSLTLNGTLAAGAKANLRLSPESNNNFLNYLKSLDGTTVTLSVTATGITGGAYISNLGIKLGQNSVGDYLIVQRLSESQPTVQASTTLNVSSYAIGALDMYLSNGTDSAFNFNNVNIKVQLEAGDTATAYQKFQMQQFPISLGTTELCKVGGSQDYIYNSGSNWYIHQEVGRRELNGSETYSYTASYAAINSITDEKPSGTAISNYFPYGRNLTNGIWIGTGSIAINFGGSIADSASFQSFINSNTPLVYYELAAAVETEITDTTLISQLNALQAAQSYSGTTVISSTGPGAPIIFNASAATSTSCTVQNNGNYFSRPQLTLYGSGTINLSLNGNQLFVINLGQTATNITIDTAAMEAYQGTPATLMNRSVDGNYNNFKLNVGKNTISWSGNVTQITINNYSRWI